MKVISKEKRIFLISGGEINIGQIRKYFRQWKPNYKLDEFICFYDFEQDAFYIGPAASKHHISFCINVLESENPANTLRELYLKGLKFKTDGSKDMTRCLMHAIINRWEIQLMRNYSIFGKEEGGE